MPFTAWYGATRLAHTGRKFRDTLFDRRGRLGLSAAASRLRARDDSLAYSFRSRIALAERVALGEITLYRYR